MLVTMARKLSARMTTLPAMMTKGAAERATDPTTTLTAPFSLGELPAKAGVLAKRAADSARTRVERFTVGILVASGCPGLES